MMWYWPASVINWAQEHLIKRNHENLPMLTGAATGLTGISIRHHENLLQPWASTFISILSGAWYPDTTLCNRDLWTMHLPHAPQEIIAAMGSIENLVIHEYYLPSEKHLRFNSARAGINGTETNAKSKPPSSLITPTDVSVPNHLSPNNVKLFVDGIASALTSVGYNPLHLRVDLARLCACAIRSHNTVDLLNAFEQRNDWPVE